MPHCILEYSANIKDSIDFPQFSKRLHALLSSSGHIDPARLKSRRVIHDDFFVGDGASENAFVYLQVSLLSGRPAEVRQALGQQALDLLTEFFPQSRRELNCSVTVEMREINSSTHFAAAK
jgi:5-carboxymethyl-2-hydroxymuconate isomerase